MKCSRIQVANPPSRPLLVYDGDCHFCTLWIGRWRQLTGDAVEYLPSQDARVAAQFPEMPRPRFDEAVQFVDTDGMVHGGADGVFRALAANRSWRWPLWAYERHSLFAHTAERAYRFVAEHRPLFSKLTRMGWGRHVEAPSYFLVRWLLLRALGLVYFFAFVSLWTQVSGLIGHHGILPADQFMAAVKEQCDQRGIGVERFHLLPTLCWFNASDSFLHFQCAAGAVLSLLLVAGIGPAPCLAFLWLLFLSLVVVGRDFLGFQWEALLLETGLLAIFVAPLQILPQPSREAPPSRLFVWLLRLLLFKLMFSSGCVKLLSGDRNWRNLTALTFHYQTQPLPPWTAWYANQWPMWFHRVSCGIVFAVELGAPFLIFMPRRIRFLGAGLLIWLQVLILLTGNYAYFNWLSLALCLLLLDDFLLERLIPRRFCFWVAQATRLCRPATRRTERKRTVEQVETSFSKGSASTFRSASRRPERAGRRPERAGRPRCPFFRRGLGFSPDPQLPDPKPPRRWPFPVLAVIAAVVLAASVFMQAVTLGIRWPALAPLGWVAQELEPFRSVNNYGLFAVMTTQRNEIVVEGSADGMNWRPYEFKYKPGDVTQRPAFIAPFQPRLDWQMWFAALGNYQGNPWFENFCERLLQGSPEVLALLAKNPFPDHPPRYIRAEFYNYRFTSTAEKRATGAWWQREYIGAYMPAISLRT